MHASMASVQLTTSVMELCAKRSRPPVAISRTTTCSPTLTFYFNIALQGVFPPRG